MDDLRQRLNSVIRRSTGTKDAPSTGQSQPSLHPDPGRFLAPPGVATVSDRTPASASSTAGLGHENATGYIDDTVEVPFMEADKAESAKQRYLSEIEIFADLSRSEIDHLAKTTAMFTTEKGKVFYFPEEAGEVVFLLKKGRVQIYRLSSEGRKLAIATLGPGAIFGEMSLIGQGMYNTFAEAIDDCLICIMSRQEMEQLLTDKPQVALRILEVMGRRLQRAETQLEEVAFKKVPERLALVLLRLAGYPLGVEPGAQDVPSSDAPAEGARRTEPILITGLTHQDLAEMVATHRETVSFTLNDFKGRGLVDLAPKCITILDVEGLRALCT